MVNLAQYGQMLYDNCWAIRLIAALLLTVTSHIRPGTAIDCHVSHSVATGGSW